MSVRVLAWLYALRISAQQDPIKEPFLKMLPSEDDTLQKKAVSSFLDILQNPSHITIIIPTCILIAGV